MMGDRDGRFLETAPVGRLLWSMALPSIAGVMAYNLYNLFDTLFLSLGVGADAVGGVSVSFPLFLFLSAVSSTLGSGGASVLSRALGQRDYERAAGTVANTFLAFYVTAVLVTVCGLLYLDPLLRMMGITEALLPYARVYTRIILTGAVTGTGFSSLIRAEGDSRYAMLIWVIPTLVNVVLDPLFIFVLRLGVAGAAMATVLSQAVSMCMSIYYFLLSGKRMLRLAPRHFVPDAALLGEIVLTGIPAFLQMSGMSVSVILINRCLKELGGTLPISAYGIAGKIHTFLMLPVTGLAQGLQPVIGYNKGAGKEARAAAAVKLASVAAGCYGAVMSLATLPSAPWLMRMFVPDQEVVRLGARILVIVNMGLAFGGLQYIQATYFQAVGRKMAALMMALCNSVICFLPALVILTGLFGLDGVWYSLPVSAAVTLILSSWLLRRSQKKSFAI